MLKADLHIHTEYSMDCDTPLEKIISRCLELGINCVNIADHGTIEGALKMQELAPFSVIVSEEILTPHGEIMGMFLRETISSGQSVEATLSQIKAQGGLVCIPHPFDTVRGSAMKSKIIEEILGQIDVMEVPVCDFRLARLYASDLIGVLELPAHHYASPLFGRYHFSLPLSPGAIRREVFQPY